MEELLALALLSEEVSKAFHQAILFLSPFTLGFVVLPQLPDQGTHGQQQLQDEVAGWNSGT